MPSGRSPPSGFGMDHPPHRIGPVRLRNQFLAQARQPPLQARRFDLPQRSFRPCPARPHLLGPAHRHDAGCPRGKSCRRAGRSGRQAPPSPCGIAFSEGSGSFSGVARLIANHLHLAIFESAPEVRVLCSAGITRPQRSYDPVRLPPWPPPFATLRPLPSPLTGLPRLPEPPFRRAVPTTPADRAGARVDCFPAHAAFPKWQEGRHPHCHFRGLLRLHSRYGPPDCSAA